VKGIRPNRVRVAQTDAGQGVCRVCHREKQVIGRMQVCAACHDELNGWGFTPPRKSDVRSLRRVRVVSLMEYAERIAAEKPDPNSPLLKPSPVTPTTTRAGLLVF
jgi:hypothetical protein